jgi:nicotinamide phosphoribosyltransferase
MDNWGYGMGGALLQQQNRDTMRFAIKCSAVRRGGEWFDVYKTTTADPGKASIGGRFDLLMYGKEDFRVAQHGWKNNEAGNLLHTVFEDGRVLKSHTLEEVRKLAASFDRYMEEE